MKFTKIVLSRVLIISVFLFSFMIFGGAVKYYQSSSFNNDGSGKISITYSAKSSDVKSKNEIIGNLPFTQAKAKEYFTSEGSVVTRAVVYPDKADPSLISVTVDINLTNLNKIKSAKGFEGVTANWVKSDTGMIFRWLFSQSNKTTNSISTYQINATFENDVKSTNGILSGKEVKWYVFGDKMDPGGAYFTATINSDGSTKYPFGSVQPKTTTGDKNTKEEDKKEGGCGLFGMELPLILFAGLVISRKFKKK